MQTANAIWVGDRLGPLHAACLKSFVRAGHRMVLHCYRVPADLPAGVETSDARQLMPEDRVIRYRASGSYALFANLFRLAILKAGLGFYVDCDVFCLKPFPELDYLFGFEAERSVNNAVLGIPADSEMLQRYLSITTDPHYIAPWLPPAKKAWRVLRRSIGLPVSMDRYAWGELGPRAATYFATKTGVLDRAQPMDVFYPVPFERISLLLDPQLSIVDVTTSRTLGVHLYHQVLKAQLKNGVPATSPLGKMMQMTEIPLPP